MATKPKTGCKYGMSDNCHRPAKCKKAFLDWVNSNPEYKKRRPRIDEVLCEARKKSSPMHVIMEHDVHKAARKYWHTEAQYYLRHVTVVRVYIKTGKIITKPVLAWVHLKYGPGGTIPEENYVLAKRVANNPIAKSTVIARAKADFIAWMKRYERFTEFFEEFDPVIKAFRRMELRRKKAG